MSKTFVNYGFTGDPDFRALPGDAQLLYLHLWLSAERTYCGAHQWRPERLSGRIGDATPASLRRAGDCLQARHFIVVDEDVEEVLIRSWMRWDGIMRKDRMAISCLKAYHALNSSKLRSVAIHELHKIQSLEPGLKCWSDDRIKDVMGHPRQSAKDLPTPADPFVDAVETSLEDGLNVPLGSVSTAPGSNAKSPLNCPTTTPTSASTSASTTSVVKGGVGGNAEDGGEGKPSRSRTRQAKKDKPEETPLPDDWEPTASHRARCTEAGINVADLAAEFRDHYEGQTAKSWNGRFATWISNAKRWRAERGQPVGPVSSPAQRPRKLITPDQIERPPHGLSDAELAVWHREYSQKLYGRGDA